MSRSTDRIPEAPTRTLAVPLRRVQRLDHGADDIVEASTGSTAVSEAYFARFLGLPFVAVMPTSTSPEKIALIEAEEGRVLVEDATTVDEAQRLAAEQSDTSSTSSPSQSATDGGATTTLRSRSSARSTERHPFREWIVVGPEPAGRARRSAATPASAATRRMCVVDPEGSIFYSAWTGDPSAFTGRPSRIEGIGRQRVEASFLPTSSTE